MSCANTSYLNQFLARVEKEEKREEELRASIIEDFQDEGSSDFLFSSEKWFDEGFNNDERLIQICCDVAMGCKTANAIKEYLIDKCVDIKMEKLQ